MPYEGEELNACGIIDLDFRSTSVVAVTGVWANPCGHVLIHTGVGLYYHVTDLYGLPKYMDEAGYRRYLQENGKSEYTRVSVPLTNPAGAASYVESALADRWLWLVLPHNCVTFAEKLLSAGGGTWSSWSNCPVIAADVPQAQVRDFLIQVINGVNHLYGVPH